MDMTIGVPYIEEANDKVKLICPVQAGEQKYAWIEVEHKEMSYLVTEVSDAFLAFLYPYAMIHNMDMYFSGKISEDIKYKFNRQIMPIMADNNKIYNRINVYAETSDIKFDNFAVGCGFSGGVDSFNCLIRNTGTEYNDYNITHLCLFDFPIIGGGVEAESSIYYKKEKEVCEIAKLYGMDFVGVRTNINEFYGPVEARWVHGAYMIGIILAMQKKFKRFFMASNYSLADVFDVRSNFDDHFSFLQLDSFSNKNISFVYESMDLKRSGKMELIVKDPIVHTYLNVCGYGANNCGVCEKCIRTQCTLDIMNSLQDFSKVFDLKQYRRNRSRYLARLHGRRHQSVFYREFDSLYKRNKGSYPVMVYLYSPWFRITGFLRILTAKNENKFLWLRRLYRNKLRKCM